MAWELYIQVGMLLSSFLLFIISFFSHLIAHLQDNIIIMSAIKNVAIVGGSGKLGSPALQYLLDAKRFNVTAITRESSSATFPDGVKVVKVNYDNKHDLVNAFKGHDVAIFIVGAQVMHTQLSLVDAAAEAGVQWIVPTEFSADSANEKLMEQITFFDIKHQVRAKIEQLGMKYLAVICHVWPEFVSNYIGAFVETTGY